MPLEVLLGKPPRVHRDVQRVRRPGKPLHLTGVELATVALDVLRHPTVASKRFLVTIGDRSVGGMRASIYNAFPEAGIDALVSFLAQFEADNAK